MSQFLVLLKSHHTSPLGKQIHSHIITTSPLSVVTRTLLAWDKTSLAATEARVMGCGSCRNTREMETSWKKWRDIVIMRRRRLEWFCERERIWGQKSHHGDEDTEVMNEREAQVEREWHKKEGCKGMDDEGRVTQGRKEWRGQPATRRGRKWAKSIAACDYSAKNWCGMDRTKLPKIQTGRKMMCFCVPHIAFPVS